MMLRVLSVAWRFTPAVCLNRRMNGMGFLIFIEAYMIEGETIAFFKKDFRVNHGDCMLN